MPTFRSIVLQTSIVVPFASACAFTVFTKHVTVNDMTHETEPLFRSEFYDRFYPEGRSSGVSIGGHTFKGRDIEAKGVLADEVVRRFPLWKLRRDLVEDAEKGGSKLVEAITGGIWGGFGYSLQRKILEQKYRNTTTTGHQLWDKSALLTSTYEPGTEVTDHFVVLSKTPTSILFRAGDSPSNSPSSPRETDGLIEITATTDMERGFAEFRMKFLFFSGTAGQDSRPDFANQSAQALQHVGAKTQALINPRTETTENSPASLPLSHWQPIKPMSENGGLMDWLHKQYAKLLLEAGLREIRV